MGNYTIFSMFENPRRGMQARNFTTNVPKILDLKSSSDIFRTLKFGAPDDITPGIRKKARLSRLNCSTCIVTDFRIFPVFKRTDGVTTRKDKRLLQCEQFNFI